MLDNVRLALKWWLDTRRATEGLIVIRALGPFWALHGVPAEDRRWVEAMLDLAERTSGVVPPALLATVLAFAGILARIQGDYEAGRGLLERSVAMWRTLRDDLGLIHAVTNLGLHQAFMGEFEKAETAQSEGLALARAAGNSLLICLALNSLGTLARLEGQHERAADYLRESLTLGTTLERSIDRAHVVGRALILLGRALSEKGELAEAMVVFERALSGREHTAGPTLGQLLDWTASVYAATGDPVRAARLFGAANEVWFGSGTKRYPFDDLAYERDLGAVRAQLDDQAFEEAFAQGRAMSAEEAIAHALRET